jgi:hypothetical protein
VKWNAISASSLPRLFGVATSSRSSHRRAFLEPTPGLEPGPLHSDRKTSEERAGKRGHLIPQNQAVASLQQWTRVPARALAHVSVLYPD